MSPELRDLPASVELAIRKGLTGFSEQGEHAIPIGIEDASGDRYGTLADHTAIAAGLEVTRIVIVVEPASRRFASPNMSTPPSGPEIACAAVVRRNSVDGHLYACELPRSDSIHGSIEDCAKAAGGQCKDPAEHHAFEPSPAAVPA